MKLEVDNLHLTLGGKEIIKGLSLTFPEQAFTGIIGPNGSGKSTFLQSIYRVLEPTKGTIYLDGKPLSYYPLKESAKKQAVLSQHHGGLFDFPVLDMVLMGRTPYKKMMEPDTKEDYDLANEALATVGMTAYKEARFSELSGGEQQRVLLARALAQKTECLILDEPTNHLDIQYQIQLLRLIKEQSFTTIAALHDLNLAAMYCDYLVAVKEGAVFCTGTVEEVLTPSTINALFKVQVEIIKRKDGRVIVVYEK